MKKKVILGLLAGVLLLFFTISSWALDWKRAQMIRDYGHPDQELDRIPVIPQTIDNYPSIIKFIFIPNIQNLPVLIYIDKSLTQVQIKSENSVKNSTIPIKE